MLDLLELLKNDMSYNTILVVFLGLLCYLWKHYEKIVRSFIKQNSKNNDILTEILEIVKNSSFVEGTISDSIDDLNYKIDNLERRLNDLEKILIETNTTDREILKDIETIRKSIEILQIIRTISKK